MTRNNTDGEGLAPLACGLALWVAVLATVIPARFVRSRT